MSGAHLASRASLRAAVLGAGVFGAAIAAIAVAQVVALGDACAGARGANTVISRARIEVPRHRVDVAHAGEAELALLPGVGPSLAASIIDERETRGGFASLDDLARVRGMGAATLDALRADAVVRGDAAAAAAAGARP